MSNILSFPTTNKPAPAIIVPAHNESIYTGTNYQNKSRELFPVVANSIEGPYGTIEGKQGIFVNEKCINVVSDRYEVHQPYEILETFQNVAESTGLTINKVLPNANNGGLLISAKYGDCKIMNENHDINLTFYTSHCGKYKTFLTLDLLRIACENQLPTLYQNKDRFIFAEKHYRNALDISLLSKALENIPASVEAYNEKAELLQDKALQYSDFCDMFISHYKLDKEAKRFTTKINKLCDVYNNARGQKGLGNNAYKAYQAITYINTHEGRNTSMKQETILTKGSNDSLKFLDLLLTA